MKAQLAKLKAELKVLANEIRELKKLRKDPNHNNGCGYVNGLGSRQSDFRIKHIARCLLRGRTMEQIESSHREENKYETQWTHKQAMALVAKITEEVASEIVRPGA